MNEVREDDNEPSGSTKDRAFTDELSAPNEGLYSAFCFKCSYLYCQGYRTVSFPNFNFETTGRFCEISVQASCH
jgi:hypothetical protein